MRSCPPLIGDAKVLWCTQIDRRHTATGNTSHVVNGVKLGPPAGLAICRYEHDEGGVYLFRCDENWETESDTWHETPERAKEQAEFEYECSYVTWIPVFE